MKIIMINAVPYGSPARIMYGIADTVKKNGAEVITVTGYSSHPSPETPNNNIIISGAVSKGLNMILSMLTGRENYYSVLNTFRLIKIIRTFCPDIIHFHNLHGWYLCLPLLLHYIKRKGIRVVWTLHDCWAMTGHCTHFAMVNCEKWKYSCSKCPLYKEYPMSLFDNSSFMYRAKKKWFAELKNVEIVTPSNWLASIVLQSYLKEKRVRVINNGIDLNTFKPMESSFKEKNGITNKYIVLGVSIAWSKRKGLDVLINLSKLLDERFQIVLIGIDSSVKRTLPGNIICIEKTSSQLELAELYSAADVFVNPTREDTFPTVNIEALACGTPVITFKTGGSVEMIDDDCGIVVDQDDIECLQSSIIKTCVNKPFEWKKCREKALCYSKSERFLEYEQLYNEIMGRG